MLSKGKKTINKDISEFDILRYYFGISKIPTVICSPLRKDLHPSFGFYYHDNHIYYKDFSTKENGNIIELLTKYFNKSEDEIIEIINTANIPKTGYMPNTLLFKKGNCDNYQKHSSTLECVVREWQDHDKIFWESFGIPISWLKKANVYPIKYKIITKDKKQYIFAADKYAYAYVEKKEGNVTLKIYQPYNTNGYKWCNKHDASVISLWNMLPKKGDKLCICASLKDALCLWCNLGIPAIAPQGEGYKISDTAVNVLKSRFTEIYILLDNDRAGLEDGKKLSSQTGFKNIILPNVNNCKDISDLYKSLTDKKEFINILKPLFYENG